MSEPTDDELEAIETEGYDSVGFDDAVNAARRALYSAGYAAGLKDAREACETFREPSPDTWPYTKCADAIAQLEAAQQTRKE